MLTMEPPARAAGVGWLVQLNDRVLRPFLMADTEEERAAEVERLVMTVVRPVCRDVIRRFSMQEWRIEPNEEEDIVSTICIRLLRKLQILPQMQEEAIARLDLYVEILAKNVLYEYLRKRYPARSRVRNRIRYIASRDPRFAIWPTVLGPAVGLWAWNGSKVVASAVDVTPSPLMRDERHPGAAIAEVLRALGKPVRLEALVAKCCEWWGVAELQRSWDVDDEPVEAPAIQRFETRQTIEVLWREIRDLPRFQRAALLLNLREPGGGRNAIAFFITLGVATIDAVALSVGMTTRELAELWDQLPLDDLTIASRFGLSRQQVINLRKSARRRLARRMIRQEPAGRRV